MISPGVASDEISESAPAEPPSPQNLELNGAVNGTEERLYEEITEYEPPTTTARTP